MKNILRVVAAIIWKDSRFLICQRPEGKKRALLWEFPGGKVEKGETDQEALVREIQEELAADIEVADRVMETEHEYSDAIVRLCVYNATLCGREPMRLEHADMRWIMADETDNYTFCPADRELLELLKSGRVQAPRNR